MSDYEKVEKLLEEYRNINIDIKGIELDIKEEGLKGISYNDMPGAPLPSNKSVVEISQLNIEKLKSDKIALEIKKEKIDNMLNALNSIELKIIKYRYVDKLIFKEIGYKVNMNADYLVTKNKSIIEKLVPYAKRFKLI
ncbi:hypothetical protein [Romboutsia sp. 1001713B170207_170306_H8]|uniref:hypothetical protein n=1 Tax=Romboutsia sp. 1001713B170207_170306_H8 TaxID=2787112 RepID=UPI001897C0B1|nr:hypothetical protein [Romboutsia sp. 1001713B170207_170306_H8]